jgi:hypothetical protein
MKGDLLRTALQYGKNNESLEKESNGLSYEILSRYYLID